MLFPCISEAGLEFEAKEVHCLGDIESLQLIPKLTIRQMKSVLQEKGVNTSSLFERSEYEKEVIKLWTNRVTDIE